MITPMDKTIVSRTVSSLIETRLIKKSPHQSDRRRQSLELTKDGYEIYEKIAVHLNDKMVSTLLSEDEEQEFIEIVKKLNAKMSAISQNRD